MVRENSEVVMIYPDQNNLSLIIITIITIIHSTDGLIILNEHPYNPSSTIAIPSPGFTVRKNWHLRERFGLTAAA